MADPAVKEAPETRFAKDQLKAIIERIERLEEEKKTISDDIRDVYAEAKGNGYDTKALRTIVRMRKQGLLVVQHELGRLGGARGGEDRAAGVRARGIVRERRLRGEVGIGKPGHRCDLGFAELGPSARNIEPAVAGEARQGRAFEIKRRCAAAG